MRRRRYGLASHRHRRYRRHRLLDLVPLHPLQPLLLPPDRLPPDKAGIPERLVFQDMPKVMQERALVLGLSAGQTARARSLEDAFADGGQCGADAGEVGGILDAVEERGFEGGDDGEAGREEGLEGADAGRKGLV